MNLPRYEVATCVVDGKILAIGGLLSNMTTAAREVELYDPELLEKPSLVALNKIDKAEARLDFRKSAMELARRVRAFDPFPGAAATLDGTVIKLWRAEPGTGKGEPGTVLSADGSGIVVACGEGVLRVTDLQKPGGKRLPAADFLHGFPVSPGQRLT